MVASMSLAAQGFLIRRIKSNAFPMLAFILSVVCVLPRVSRNSFHRVLHNISMPPKLYFVPLAVMVGAWAPSELRGGFCSRILAVVIECRFTPATSLEYSQSSRCCADARSQTDSTLRQ